MDRHGHLEYPFSFCERLLSNAQQREEMFSFCTPALQPLSLKIQVVMAAWQVNYLVFAARRLALPERSIYILYVQKNQDKRRKLCMVRECCILQIYEEPYLQICNPPFCHRGAKRLSMWSLGCLGIVSTAILTEVSAASTSSSVKP